MTYNHLARNLLTTQLLRPSGSLYLAINRTFSAFHIDIHIHLQFKNCCEKGSGSRLPHNVHS